MASGRMTQEHGKKLIWMFLALGVILAAILVLPGLFEKEAEIVPEEVSPDFGTLAKKEYNGKTYVERVGLTPILLIGVDRGENAPAQWGYQQGGQADFLLLAVIDPGEKRVSMLQIDRDTIADVEVLGVLGNVIGTRQLQIALSHSYGKTQQDNCAYTVKSVSNFMQGQPLELYFALDMAGIPDLNDLLGGVTVTMEDDHTLINPAFVKGARIHLTGPEAYQYVHSRRRVDDGTNSSRMARQKNYMNAARNLLISRLTKDSGFVDALFEQLADHMTTNITRGRMINEAAKASQFEIGEITQLKGEHVIAADGYMQFHVDEEDLINWVLSVFYKPYEG